MPIRFYCPFCDQLLGVSSRKVGAVVECPRCHGKVGVPRQDAPAPPVPSPPLPPLPAPVSADIVLSAWQVVALGVLLVILAAFAFTAGLVVGALS